MQRIIINYRVKTVGTEIHLTVNVGLNPYHAIVFLDDIDQDQTVQKKHLISLSIAMC